MIKWHKRFFGEGMAGLADRPRSGRPRTWVAPRDPNFAERAAITLDLYAQVFDGWPLGDDEFVICADKKTSIQARCRCHPMLSPGKARLMRVEHEYKRRGALAYLAAYDVHRPDPRPPRRVRRPLQRHR